DMSVPTLVSAPPVPYAGLATRAVALAADVAIAQVIVFAGGAVLALSPRWWATCSSARSSASSPRSRG
ncbi:MAG TPA: hypothetical protein VH741_09965, partial [Candidatus Limnocylindrales bacterium]